MLSKTQFLINISFAVTKVVWEGEAGDSITDKTTTKSDVGTRYLIKHDCQENYALTLDLYLSVMHSLVYPW